MLEDILGFRGYIIEIVVSYSWLEVEQAIFRGYE